MHVYDIKQTFSEPVVAAGRLAEYRKNKTRNGRRNRLTRSFDYVNVLIMCGSVRFRHLPTRKTLHLKHASLVSGQQHFYNVYLTCLPNTPCTSYVDQVTVLVIEQYNLNTIQYSKRCVRFLIVAAVKRSTTRANQKHYVTYSHVLTRLFV